MHDSGPPVDEGEACEDLRPRPWTTADGDAVVRPFGYVHDEPVLVRVPGSDAWLGNVHAAKESADRRSFGYVLSLTETAQPATTHHRPFADARDHDAAAFRAAVDDARVLLARDGALLVHCKAGISRSAAVLATAIAAADGKSFREALTRVHDARAVATPHPALVESVITYLAADHNRY
jgi:atypical dual specificity phosphatase